MKIINLTCLILLFSLALSSDLFSEEEKANLFKSRDIFDLEYAGDPRISPDGRQIIYERRSMDIMTDSVRSNLWIINSDKEPRSSPLRSASSIVIFLRP